MLKRILSAALVLTVTAARADIELVKDSKSSASIVIDPKAFPITKRAAKDLQLYIKKATGAELPVTEKIPASGPRVFVGDSEQARKAGIDVSSMKPESFVIKTAGGDLYIVGKDSDGAAGADHWRSAPRAGTWSGVSEFLEKYLDVRWFFPGERGEYVPAGKNLTIGNLDVSGTPGMEFRRMNYLRWNGQSEEKTLEAVEWARRNKNGWSVIWQGSHSWIENFRGEDYFKDHPEWFALVSGRRLGQAPHGLQMCTTNPEALDKFAEIIVKLSNEREYKKDNTMFTLSPNDGGNHCECEKCQALDNGARPDGTRVMTDRYVTYCNETAKRVGKTLPWQTFGFYAYSYYTEPPEKTVLDPHVKVMYVLNDIQTLYYSAPVRERFNAELKGWKKAVGSLYFYTHPEGMGNMALPAMHPSVIKSLFHDLAAAGVTGIDMNNGEPFQSTGLDNYLYEKMAWNPSGDMDSIYDDALKKCYGEEAAPYVRKYFETVEKAVAKLSRTITVDEAMGSARRFPGLLTASYQGLYEEGMPLLQKAAAVNADENQKHRLRMLTDNLEYCRGTAELYSLFQKINKSQNPDKKDVLRGLELAQKHLSYLRGLEKEGSLNLAVEQRREKEFNMPFSTGIYSEILRRLEGGSRKIYAAEVPAAELVNGMPSGKFWEKCQPFDVSLDKNTGDTLPVKADVKIAYDKNNVYIKAVCAEPLMSRIKDSCVKHDGAVWNENDTEIFFDVKNTQKNYKQICVNTLGTTADFDAPGGNADSKWDSGAVVSAHKGGKDWTLEISVPFKNLSGAAPEPGDIWGFNMCRVRHTVEPAEYSCWSPTFGGFGVPERFGKLIFK